MKVLQQQKSTEQCKSNNKKIKKEYKSGIYIYSIYIYTPLTPENERKTQIVTLL